MQATYEPKTLIKRMHKQNPQPSETKNACKTSPMTYTAIQ